MSRPTVFLIGCMALVCGTPKAHAEGGYCQPDEMIRRSDHIAIITIERVVPLPKTEWPWAYGQLAHARVEREIKGALPPTVDLYGEENFVCQTTQLSPGRFLAFLRLDRTKLHSCNYQMGIRPIRGKRVEWYYDNGRGTLSANFGYSLRWQRLGPLLRHIALHQGSNPSLQRTAGRSDASPDIIKTLPFRSTLVPASGR